MTRWGVVLAVLVIVLTAGWFFMPFPWMNSAEPINGQPPRPDQFAEDRAPPPTKKIPFDGDRAIKYLKQLCAIGPRVSGSTGMRKQQELLKEHFEKHGAKVTFQRFTARQPSQPRAITMANLIASWHPERKRRVILCGHYDTRPIADREPRRADWFKPFVSANDGTSTVAWLMELAHHMEEIPTEVGVDFVLFDGEEWIYNDRHTGGRPPYDRYFLGSEHFAKVYRTERRNHTYLAAILLDLFAAKNAVLEIEENSWFHAARLVQQVWKIAAEQECNAFRARQGDDVRDDHIPLNNAGIPAIDIIDFDYAHWHKLSDLPEQCSADRMAQVGKVLSVWLQRVR